MRDLLKWIADHLQRYLDTDGADGHMWDSAPVGGPGPIPTLLLTTTGRRSGKPIVMPLIYSEAGGNAVQWTVSTVRGPVPRPRPSLPDYALRTHPTCVPRSEAARQLAPWRGG